MKQLIVSAEMLVKVKFKYCVYPNIEGGGTIRGKLSLLKVKLILSKDYLKHAKPCEGIKLVIFRVKISDFIRLLFFLVSLLSPRSRSLSIFLQKNAKSKIIQVLHPPVCCPCSVDCLRNM